MNTALARRPATGLTRDDPRRLALFAKTVGKDLRGAEIDEAVEWCEHYGANPFLKDIYFFVFDPDKDTRRVVPVLGIGLYRRIAARTGDYRPDDRPPRFSYRDASPVNPAGIVACEVTVYRHAHGAWHPITASLKWEERAPLKEVWAEDERGKRRPTGQLQLDPKKTNWRTMPETMLAKCVEADALRKGWPDALSGSYVPEEMDAARTIELTATEIIDGHETAARQARVGTAGAILIDWLDGGPAVPVAVGQLGDQALAFIAAHEAEEPAAVMAWWAKNQHAMRDYWARDKDGALAVKQRVEAIQSAMAAPPTVMP